MHTLLRRHRRFYHVVVQTTLVDHMAVVRVWGRVGSWQQTKINPCASWEEAQGLAQKFIARKLKRGYTIISTSTEEPNEN